MNSAQQLKDKIILMKEKANQYDKLNQEYSDFQYHMTNQFNLLENQYRTLTQNQLETGRINNILEDRISGLIGEIDDLKGGIICKIKDINLLNREVQKLESFYEQCQKNIRKLYDDNLKLQKERDQYVEFSNDLKERVYELSDFLTDQNKNQDNIAIFEKFAEDYKNKCVEVKMLQRNNVELTKHNLMCLDEIVTLKNKVNSLETMKSSNDDIIKTVIGEIGGLDWSIISDQDIQEINQIINN
jgi:chromosome segregation ATPase